MAYVKQTWSNGETLSASKLEHLREGIYKSNILYVTIAADYDDATDTNTYYSDVDYEEVKSSILAGRLVVFKEEYPGVIYGGVPMDDGFTYGIGSFIWGYDESSQKVWIGAYLYFDPSGVHYTEGEIIK